ncbi:sensor histidine kinase [Kitasatospora sp. HPMI-4]|uniref:sensor histidine kinase n=1 Tax=Kitasatospora sp. HPMI-4 TaxID=3448443 RepID=UPI003F1C8166
MPRAHRVLPGRAPWSGRMPTRLRTSVAAGSAALLLLGGGAWWLREHVYGSRLAANQSQALYQARTIARDNAADQGATTVRHADTVGLPYVVLDPTGRMVVVGGPLVGQTLIRDELTPAPKFAPPSWSTVRTVRIGHRPGGGRYAGRTFTAVGAYSHVLPMPADQGRSAFTGEGDYTVYVLVTPFEAEDAVAAVDPALLVGVPVAALLVAAIAWASTSRALRPVEAIRAELAEIGEQRLDRRVPVPAARDEISRMAVTTNDTLDRLQRAAEQQRRFVADASHELRSPISALRTNLEVSLAHPERTDWPTGTREALRAVKRLQQLTEDLLYLTRPGTAESAATVVDLTDLAQDLVTETRHLLPGGPTVELDAAGPVLVHGRQLALHRLLRNLLDNAVRHARSQVRITVRGTGDTAVVDVHNDGAGIPPEDRERIFERFTRLDEARSRDSGGSGLGLAIAREIATRHHGTLRLAGPCSDGGTGDGGVPDGGSGATFRIRLPRV